MEEIKNVKAEEKQTEVIDEVKESVEYLKNILEA